MPGKTQPTAAPWPAATGASGYDILGRHLRNGEHGEVEKLTTNREEEVCGVWKASEGRVDDGGDGWREGEVRVR